jgi:hypothetical protein
MGMSPAPEPLYEAAVRLLFPRGEYWDRQFADPQSDVSLFARVKTAEIFRFRRRMADLYGEGTIGSARETLGDWERVLLGAESPWLDPAERRARLAAVGDGGAGIGAIREAGGLFGVTVTDVSLPFRPAFLGHCRFGVDRIADESGFSVVVVRAKAAGERRDEFEAHVRATVLVTNIVHFIYGG